jgi:rfaE bifunctional protein nucleotidyltransferase chain/domain
MLSALSFVDSVILFEEDTPWELINAIKPSILVKGSDYQKEEIVGYDILQEYGGEVRTIELTEGFSTTNFIKKIQNLG